MFGNTNVSPQNLKSTVADTDRKLWGWLSGLHTALNRDKISLRELDSLMSALNHMAEDAREDYLNSLLYPESVTGKKIPTLFPIPSTTFQLHLVGTSIATNSSGNMAWTWNPCFLQDTSIAAYSTFYVNNNNALTGSGNSNNFLATDLQYNQIPANLYGNYRLVSASIVVSYVGRMDICSGVIAMGIGLNNANVAPPQTVGSTDANSQLFGNFLQIDNLLFSERTQSANGARAIYFPIDDRYTNFLNLLTNAAAGTPGSLATSYNTGFYFAGYAQSLPASLISLRFDFYINYEAIVTPQYNNFIPQSVGSSSSIDAVQAASLLTNKNSDKIISGSSDIPGGNDNNISSANVFSKLAGSSELPNIDIVKKLAYKY
jgi:hypothetical protein